MKKKLKFVFFGLLFLTLGYCAYTKYQNDSSLKGVVHENAVSVIKLGIHDIKETLFLDVLSSPGYYFNNIDFTSSSKDNENEDKVDKGVQLTPYNLLAFTMPNMDNTIFSVFNISNKRDFENYLKRDFGDKIKLQPNIKDKTYKTAQLKGGYVTLGWNDKKLVMAASIKLDLDNIDEVFSDLLVDDKFIYSSDYPLLKLVHNTDGHLVYADGSGASSLKFEDGKAALRGLHKTKTSFNKEVIVLSHQNQSFAMHYTYPFWEKSKKNFAKQMESISFFEKNGLNPDSIFYPLDGKISLDIAGRTMQKDTVIVYDYDDNFEKVAQKSVQEKGVPQIYLNLGGSKDDFLNYLRRIESLTPENILKPVPLYKLQVTESANGVVFSTNHDSTVKTQKRSSYFFQLQVNFEKLQKDLNSAKTKKLFSLVRDLKIHAWQENNILLEGELRGKENNINILSQVFFGLKQEESPKTEVPEL